MTMPLVRFPVRLHGVDQLRASILDGDGISVVMKPGLSLSKVPLQIPGEIDMFVNRLIASVS